jgi:hypothetical protein
MKKLLSMLFLLALLVSCSNKTKEKAKNFVQALNASSASNYSLTKWNTQIAGYVVVQNTATGEYVAYNLSLWNKDLPFSDFSAAATGANDIVSNLFHFTEDRWEERSRTVTDSEYEYVDSGYWDYDEVWDEDVWVDTSGYEWVDYSYTEYYDELVTYHYYEGNGLVFDETDGKTKDLEKIGALAESGKINALGSAIASDYGLSESRSIELAKLATNYAKVSQNRAMTEKDLKSFSTEVLGTDLSTFQKAIENDKQGNENNLEDLIEKAAELNGTTPEHFSKIISNLMK